MSIDLEWSKLDSSLSSYLVDVLNRQLTSTTRPSFIGPVEVTSLDFGSVAPDVELVDLRDIYRDFLEDDEADDDPRKVTAGPDDIDGFEWVPRRVSVPREEGPAYQHLPPHIRYGRSDLFSAIPALHSPGDVWSATGTQSGAGLRRGYTPWPAPPMYRSPSPATPYSAPVNGHKSGSDYLDELDEPSTDPPSIHGVSTNVPEQQPQQPSNPHPNLQVHLHVNWHSNLRITLSTSLLINYPSPMFMSLPIKLSVTGLIFTGELAVAYEGERRRVHICILDDLDPYGPAGDRPKRDSASSTPPEPDYEASPASGGGAAAHHPYSKPLPVGQRLLPSIYIESEIGQADKHVLKNVTRVERFIQDVIRKTVEEELMFPNFHTLLIGDQ